MLFPSLLIVLAFASSAAVHAKSKLSPDMELRPKTWTSTGPNNVSYTLSSNGTDPLYYDVFLQTLVFSTGQTYTTLTRQNQPIANGQWINVTVFPGEMVNETRKELSYEESYSVRIEGHVRRNTTAEEGESQDWVESGPVNLTDPNAPSASATAKAGGSSSVMSFPSVAGPLMAIVGLLVAGGLSVV